MFKFISSFLKNDIEKVQSVEDKPNPREMDYSDFLIDNYEKILKQGSQKYKYFSEPLKYSYTYDQKVNCDFCKKDAICFDLSHLSSEPTESSVCESCVLGGEFEKKEICFSNDYDFEKFESCVQDLDQRKEIERVFEYYTPLRPTWQDGYWPILDNDFGHFIKIADLFDIVSLAGDLNPVDFFLSILEKKENIDFEKFEYLFEYLPKTRITDLKSGNFDTSFYLFKSTKKEKYLLIWDAN